MLKHLPMKLYKLGHRLLSGRGLAAFYPIRMLDNLMLRTVRPKRIDVLGHSMLVDSVDSLRLSVNGIYEPLETRFVQENVRQGMTVVDVGAHVGYYTLLFARLVGNQGKVFAFEPDPENFAILQQNVALNGYSNVITVQKAVSDRSGTLSLYLSSQYKGDHRIYDSHDHRTSIEVGAVTLDEFFTDEPARIDLIKMDIQGAEGLALRGMTRILDQHERLTLVSEFWPGGLQRSGVLAGEYLDVLIGHGFSFQEVNEREGSIRPIEAAALLSSYPATTDEYTNLVCMRR
jgi:FkbM family methyltransferase